MKKRIILLFILVLLVINVWFVFAESPEAPAPEGREPIKEYKATPLQVIQILLPILVVLLVLYLYFSLFFRKAEKDYRKISIWAFVLSLLPVILHFIFALPSVINVNSDIFGALMGTFFLFGIFFSVPYIILELSAFIFAVIALKNHQDLRTLNIITICISLLLLIPLLFFFWFFLGTVFFGWRLL